MARRSLTEEQRQQLLTWLAADYPPFVIREWAREAGGWPPLSDRLLYYYRHSCEADLLALRAARRESALNTGLAIKEERVAALVAHAEALALIKWVPDRKTGKLHNEKAWRETLDDIAQELGQRTRQVDLTSGGQPLESVKVYLGFDPEAV
jgi:hypothetical protein